MKHLALCAGAAALYILISASLLHALFIGPEIPISTAANTQWDPSIAYDPASHRFLVTWEDYRSGTEPDIYGQIVSSDGTLIGGNFTISTAARYQYEPSLAYDPLSQRFLVAWGDNRSGTSYDIYGQFVSPTGTLIGEDFTISTAASNQYNPSVAYDSVAQRFFVAWTDGRNGVYADIYGQIVSSDGTLIGGNFPISTGVYNQGGSSVAYDSIAQRFLVAWMDIRSGTYYDIYGQIVSPDGTLIGGNFPISTAAYDQAGPSVAYDPVTQRFLVAWADQRNDFFWWDIYGQIISSTGTLLGGEISISLRPEDRNWPSVAYDPVVQQFLVVYGDYRSVTSFHDIYGQFVSPTGSLIGEDFTISRATDDERYPSVAYGPGAQRFLVAWTVLRYGTSNYDILGRILKDGDISTDELPSGTTYVPYTALLQAPGGTQPYSWIITSGALPPGLTLSSTTGKITGIPTMSGVYSFKVQVTDADGCVAIHTIPLKISITDRPPRNKPPLVAVAASPSSGLAPLTVTFTVTASDPDGTIAQYRWDFNGDGTLDLITTTSTTAYTYTTPGAYPAVVTVADDRGATAFAYSMINVLGPSFTERTVKKEGCGCATNIASTPKEYLSNIFFTIVPILYSIWRKKRRDS